MLAKELLQQLTEDVIERPDVYAADLFRQKYNGVLEKIPKPENCVQEYVSSLIQPIFDVMTPEEKQHLGNIEVAAIPMMEMNAKTIKASFGEHVVVINKRLMGLIYSWGELGVMPILQNNYDKDSYARNFAPIIDSYLTPNSSLALPIIPLDAIPFSVAEMLALKAKLAEQFILAHEFAHIVLGHLVDCTDYAIHQEFIAQIDNQQKELDADVKAMKWMEAICGKDSEELLFFCAEIFVLFHYIECNTSFPKQGASHPPALLRLVNIQTHFPQINGISQMIKNCMNIDSFRIK